jgi:hypothetical protein
MDWLAVSATNKAYEDKAQDYLHTLAKAYLPCTPLHLTVDYDATLRVPGIEYERIESSTFQAPSPIQCLQHGDFLSAVKGKRPERILFTDCDIHVQRDMTVEEAHRIATIQDGQVWCSYNNGEGDSLFHEALRLHPVEGNIQAVFGNPKLPFHRHPMYYPVYNTGVLAMHVDTWQEVFDRYCELWPVVNPLMTHYAKQQWLLCYLFTEMKLDVNIWPESFHAHGCFNMIRPAPKRFSWHPTKNTLHVDGDEYNHEVLFRHNWGNNL